MEPRLTQDAVLDAVEPCPPQRLLLRLLLGGVCRAAGGRVDWAVGDGHHGTAGVLTREMTGAVLGRRERAVG